MLKISEKTYEYLEEVNDGIVKQLPPNHDSRRPLVLDAGCGRGALGEALEQRNYSVWGIEANEQAATVAGTRLSRVIQGDLLDFATVRSKVGGTKFDYVIFSDVLEHVYDPYSVLQNYLELLNDGGLVLISVPNAVVWPNRLRFLAGVFEYAATGVMDRTHIRFFTFKTAQELVRGAGCEIVAVSQTPYFVRALLPLIKRIYGRKSAAAQTENRRSILESPAYEAYMKYVYPAECAAGSMNRSLFAFRIIVVGRKLAPHTS